MKKATLVFSILMFLSAGVAHATNPDRTGKWEAGFDLSSRMSDSTDIDPAVYLGGNVDYGVTRWLALGTSAGWSESDLDAINGFNNRVHVGSLTVTPVFLDLIFRSAERESPRVYYGIVGLGAVLSSVDVSTNALQAQSRDAFATKLGIGMDWFLTEHWILKLEVSYVFTGAELNIIDKANGHVVDSKDLEFWFLGGGIKYLFD